MTASVDICILPCEVRRHIWNHCDKPSLKVLSLCSKSLYAEVNPFVWKRVEISWQALEDITKDLIKNPHPNLHLISCLVLGAPRRNTSLRARKLPAGYIGFGFVSFLQRCEQLKSLTITHFLPADGLRLVSEIPPQLQNLELKGNDTEIRDGDLKPLFGLRQLKSLTIEKCSIQKSDWNVIWQLESLEHLTMTEVSPPEDSEGFIPGGGFRLNNLRSLTFFGSAESSELYLCISQTSVKLESLDLTWSSIQDSDILNLSRLSQLKSISLFGACQITDLGITHLTNLSCLEQLQVGFCTRLSPHCLEDMGKIQTLTILDLDEFSEDPKMPKLTNDALRVVAQLKRLRKLFIGENHFTEEGIRHLAQLPHLKTLKIENVSDEVLEKHGLLDKVTDCWMDKYR